MAFVSKENLQSILSTFKSNVTSQINTAVAGVNSLGVEVVAELPVADISTTTIYLVPAAQSGAENLYDEYMYVNSAWEKFGNVAVDLSSYNTATEVDTKITNALASYATDAEVSSAVAAAAPVEMTTEEITTFNSTLWA